MRLPSTAQHDRHDIRSSPGKEKCREQNLDMYMVFVNLTKPLTQSAEMVYGRYYERLAALTCLSTSYGHSTKGWWPEYKIKDKRQSHSREHMVPSKAV